MALALGCSIAPLVYMTDHLSPLRSIKLSQDLLWCGSDELEGVLPGQMCLVVLEMTGEGETSAHQSRTRSHGSSAGTGV